MLYAFTYFNLNVNSFFHCVLLLMQRGCMCSLMLCFLQTRVGLESPKAKKGLTEAFCFSSAIQNIFKQGGLKIPTSCFFLSWRYRHPCQGSCIHVQPSPGLRLYLASEPNQPHLGPPPTHPQLVALRVPFKLSPELCCECACLQPWMDSGLSRAVSRVADGLWKEHLSLLLCPDAVGLGEGENSGAAPDTSSLWSSSSPVVILAPHQ